MAWGDEPITFESILRDIDRLREKLRPPAPTFPTFSNGPELLRGGMPVLLNEYMVDSHLKQVHFPRSKKRRIQKKWRKNQRNWRHWTTPKKEVYQVEGRLVMQAPNDHFVLLLTQEERLRKALVSASQGTSIWVTDGWCEPMEVRA